MNIALKIAAAVSVGKFYLVKLRLGRNGNFCRSRIVPNSIFDKISKNHIEGQLISENLFAVLINLKFNRQTLF